MTTDDGRVAAMPDVHLAYYSVRQVSIMLAVDRKTIYKLITCRQLPGATRVLGAWRIPKASVRKLMAT